MTREDGTDTLSRNVGKLFAQLINYLFQQMHHTILVFSCLYICFGTYNDIFRGVVESS
jgi:hypothetical protein